jgi:uncharacterized membrane protein YesL
MNNIIVIMIVFADFCQYNVMGPDFRSLSSVILDLSRVPSVDLSGLIEMSEGVLWLTLDIVYVLCAVWLVVSVLVFLKLDIRFENSSTCRNFG